MKRLSALKTLSLGTDFSLCIASGIYCCTSCQYTFSVILYSPVLPVCLILLQYSFLPNPANVNSASLVASLAVRDGYPRSSAVKFNKFWTWKLLRNLDLASTLFPLRPIWVATNKLVKLKTTFNLMTQGAPITDTKYKQYLRDQATAATLGRHSIANSNLTSNLTSHHYYNYRELSHRMQAVGGHPNLTNRLCEQHLQISARTYA